MDENIQKDGLEDFLKKSFEDFERNPSDGLWDKIDAGLNAPAAPKIVQMHPGLTFKTWWIGLAAALFLGAFAWQYFYFQEKIEGLSEKVAQQNQRSKNDEINSIQPSDDLKSENQNAAVEPKSDAIQNNADSKNLTNGTLEIPIQNIESQQVENKNARQNLVENSFPKNESGQQKSKNQQQNLKENFTKNTHPNGVEPNVLNENQIEKLIENSNQNVAVETQPEAQNVFFPPENEEQKPIENQKQEDKSLKTNNLVALNLLPSLGFSKLDSPQEIFFSQLPMVKPLRQKSWTVGVHAAKLATRATAEFQPQRFPDPKDHGKRVAQDKAVSGNTVFAGVSLEKKLAKNWSFVSGFDFREANLTGMHKAEFEFRDRKNGGPGPGHDHEHDFNYNLNNGGGSATIEFRVDETDPTQHIDDDEKIEFEAKTQQKTQWISVPLAAKFSVGRGRWQFNLKGGVAANFLIFNDFTITDLSISNPKFKIEPQSSGQKMPDPLQKLTLDGLVSAGIEYRFNKTFSLVAEPMVMTNLMDYQNLDFAKINNFMYGMNLGFNYRF